MTVAFRHAHEFPVSASRLRALLQDPDAAAARARRLSNAVTEVVWEPEARLLEMRQARATGFDTARFETVQRTSWDADGNGAWTLEQTAGPGVTRARGTVTVAPVGEHRARLTVEGDLSIDAGPFTGLVERMVRARITQLRERDAALMREQLAG